MTTPFKFLPFLLLTACDYGYPFTAGLGVESDDAQVGPSTLDVALDAGKPEAKEIATKPEAGEAAEATADAHAEATEAAIVFEAAAPVDAQTDADAASDATPPPSDGCTPILHKEANGPASWSACYPLNTFTKTSATDACNAYFSQFYQDGTYSPCTPAFCPNAALPSAEMVCGKMLGADGGVVNQICWLYEGSLVNVGGAISAGTSCSSLDPCGGTCESSSQWQ